MRDYENMPVLVWKDALATRKAMAQVHHAEPVIIQFPQDFNMGLDIDACACQPGRHAEHHIDCSAQAVLQQLANINNQPEFSELAQIAHEAAQVVDVDTRARRIVIHD